MSQSNITQILLDQVLLFGAIVKTRENQIMIMELLGDGLFLEESQIELLKNAIQNDKIDLGILKAKVGEIHLKARKLSES